MEPLNGAQRLGRIAVQQPEPGPDDGEGGEAEGADWFAIDRPSDSLLASACASGHA